MLKKIFITFTMISIIFCQFFIINVKAESDVLDEKTRKQYNAYRETLK